MNYRAPLKTLYALLPMAIGVALLLSIPVSKPHEENLLKGSQSPIVDMTTPRIAPKANS